MFVLLFRNLAYLALGLGLLVYWLPFRVFERQPHWPEPFCSELNEYAAVPLGIASLAALLHSWWLLFSRGRGTPLPWDPPQKLVQRGLYRWVRNPIYLSLLGLIAAEALYLSSIHLWVYWICLVCIFQLIVRLNDEPDLSFRFGAMYEDYKRATPRWLPRAPKPQIRELTSTNRER